MLPTTCRLMSSAPIAGRSRGHRQYLAQPLQAVHQCRGWGRPLLPCSHHGAEWAAAGGLQVDSLRTQLKDATKSFRDVLTLRTDNLRGNEDRRRMFSASPPQRQQQQRPQQRQNGQQSGAPVAQQPTPFPPRSGEKRALDTPFLQEVGRNLVAVATGHAEGW